MTIQDDAEGKTTGGEQQTGQPLATAEGPNDSKQEGQYPAHKTQEAERSLKNRIKQLATELKLSDWLMVALTAVIAGSTVWNTIYVGGQLAEMRSSGQDTKNLVVATRHLADAATIQANDTGDLVAAAKAQAGAMEKLREAGEEQADALDRLRSAGEAQAGAMEKLQIAGEAQAKASNNLAQAGTAQGDGFRPAVYAIGGNAVLCWVLAFISPQLDRG